jgi:hypothetical protein
VFTTEAHPLPIFEWGDWEKLRYGIPSPKWYDEHSRSEWLDCLDLMASQSSPLFRDSTLKAIDLVLDQLPSRTKRGPWLSWIDLYPEPWKRICTRLSSSDWKRAQATIQSAAIAARRQNKVPRLVFATYRHPWIYVVGSVL